MKYEFDKEKARSIWGDDQIGTIARDIFDRIDEDEFENIDKAITCTADDYLIDWDDQWELLKAYQPPRDANYNEAFELFVNDLKKVIKEKK